MARVNKVGHVVLNVKDVDASVKFYTEALGMELMAKNQRNMAFLSFGSQHHDIALFPAPEGAERGDMGLNHIAMQIEGGEQELRELYGNLVKAGAQVDHTSDHGLTHSVYFQDPDGNHLEIFCEMMNPEEGLQFMKDSQGYAKPLELEPII
ncbi:MAG: VOC family protein [Dehalococcoidia bacterium]